MHINSAKKELGIQAFFSDANRYQKLGSTVTIPSTHAVMQSVLDGMCPPGTKDDPATNPFPVLSSLYPPYGNVVSSRYGGYGKMELKAI